MIRLAAFLTLLAAPATGERLHCLGISPGFMLVTDGKTAFFDYLGDGEFTLNPALPAEIDGWTQTTLVASAATLPVYLEERACRVLGTDLPLRIELGVETSAGFRPFAGCCHRAAR